MDFLVASFLSNFPRKNSLEFRHRKLHHKKFATCNSLWEHPRSARVVQMISMLAQSLFYTTQKLILKFWVQSRYPTCSLFGRICNCKTRSQSNTSALRVLVLVVSWSIVSALTSQTEIATIVPYTVRIARKCRSKRRILFGTRRVKSQSLAMIIHRLEFKLT